MLLLLLPAAHATPGEVTLPLDAWHSLHPPPPQVTVPQQALPISRLLRGRVERGLLDAELTVRVHALASLAFPVLPAEATVSDARLDGRPAPLSLDDHYRIELTPGDHLLELGLLQGQPTDRFERRVHLDLPDGGPTTFELLLPEAPVDVTLAAGVVTSSRPVPGGTRVTGWLDGTGDLDLAWERRATHEATDARLDSEVHALLDLGGDLVSGRGAYRFDVLAGEVDRMGLDLPEGLEITAVEGSDVLQWHTTAGRLEVLLRRVVDDRVDLDVQYQYPADLDGPTDLRMPLPEGPVRGALGVVAPVAIEVSLADVQHAEVLAPRDMPQGLVELSAEPLRLGLSFDEAPTASASTTRTGEVLTSASRIDDLQGISLVMEDGTEVGKLRLAVRNADRQVLTVQLPDGARLTHCYRDGSSLRPAADRDHPGRVLVPLTRSARAQRQQYVIQAGDTLSRIAVDNYGDAVHWQTVQLANPGLDTQHLQVGDVIDLPSLAGAETESFVLELGWERSTPALGPVGQRQVGLPELDLEVMAATWHLYLPEHIQPLTIDANLTQVSGRHTDPLTRALDFLVHSGLGGSNAYAGDSYKNALLERRNDWFDDAQQQRAAAPLSAYPLVGQRIRFRGHLLGTSAPAATVRYVGEGVAALVHQVVWLGALLGAAAVALRPRSRVALACAGVGLALGGVVGHYLLGTYGLLVSGADLGLFLGLLPWLWAHRRRPRAVEGLLGLTAMAFGGLVLLAKPSLVPLLVGAVLALTTWRSR